MKTTFTCSPELRAALLDLRVARSKMLRTSKARTPATFGRAVAGAVEVAATSVATETVRAARQNEIRADAGDQAVRHHGECRAAPALHGDEGDAMLAIQDRRGHLPDERPAEARKVGTGFRTSRSENSARTPATFGRAGAGAVEVAATSVATETVRAVRQEKRTESPAGTTDNSGREVAAPEEEKRRVSPQGGAGEGN